MVREQHEDFSKMPYNSIRAAQLRMVWDYNDHNSYDPLDLRLVLGDQKKDDSVDPDPTKLREQFLAISRENEAFILSVKPALEKRHQDYLNSGRYAAALMLMEHVA